MKIKSIKWSLLVLILPLIIGTQQLGYDRDYSQYYKIFTLDSHVLNESRYEPIFIFLVIFFQKIGISTSFFYIIFAYVSIVPKLNLIRKYSYKTYTPYLYYFSPFLFLHDDTQIRLATSIAFVVLAIDRYFEKKIIYSVVFFLVASGFQYQSIAIIITLPLIFFLEKIAFDVKSIIKLLILLLILYIFITNIESILKLPSSYISIISIYVETETKPNAFNAMILLNILLSAWGAKILSINKKAVTPAKIFWLLGVFGIISYYLLIQIGNIAFRISEAFLFFNCFWIGYAIKNNAYFLNKKILYGIIALLVILNVYNLTNPEKPFYFRNPLELYE